MSMLLLIRSADDVRAAVETAREFLVYRRQRSAEARAADEILGIWFSRSGLWTLCWIAGTLLSTAHSATERRRTILESLFGTASALRPSSAVTGTFFPVFAAADAVESIKATMSELEVRYPQMIGGTWFFDDREGGIVPARG